MNLIDIKEAARTIGVHENTIRNWINAGILPAVKIGPRFIRIKPEELLALVNGVKND